MVRSDKDSAIESARVGGVSHDEGEEIDRIMKEIEDLEKKMDGGGSSDAVIDAAGDEPSAGPSTGPSVQAITEEGENSVEVSQSSMTRAATSLASSNEDYLPEGVEEAIVTSKVVPMRSTPLGARHESLAESDAVPAFDEPLVRNAAMHGDEGGLSLKIGGCTEVNLEFSRGGISVRLACSDDGLTITTDQGAEFRIPFKRPA